MSEKQFSASVIDAFSKIKQGSGDGGSQFFVPCLRDGVLIGRLKPLTVFNLAENEENRVLVSLLAKWRRAAAGIGFDVFNVTEEGTRKWLKVQVIDKPDRLLFLVETLEGVPFGHMGFFRGEVDNFIRGEKSMVPGGMAVGLLTMLNWAFTRLNIDELFLRVFSDNLHAVSFYQRCGFMEVSQIPLYKVENNGATRWVEEARVDNPKPDRFFTLMRQSRADFNEQSKGKR